MNKLTSQYGALWALCSLEAHTGQGYKCVVCKRSLISNSTWQRQFANSITMQRERSPSKTVTNKILLHTGLLKIIKNFIL